MIRGRDRGSNDALVCADVLGAFGVTPSGVRRRVDGDGSLESTLADALGDARDRTEFCRRLICDGDRGIDCAARYGAADLAPELRSLLEGIGWSATVERSGDEGFDVAVTDSGGRRREVGVSYPDTPLGANNLPAVLSTLERRLLTGVDARFVLLSDGADRWRAALIETDELERVRERYGDRVSAFDRSLLARFDPVDYVPDRTPDGRDGVQDRVPGGRGETPEPWPDWTVDGTARAVADSGPSSRSSAAASVDSRGGPNRDSHQSTEAGVTAVDELIEEAESDGRDEATDASGTERTLGEMWATDEDGADGDSESTPADSSSADSNSTGAKPTATNSGNTEATETEPPGAETAGWRVGSRANPGSASAGSSADSETGSSGGPGGGSGAGASAEATADSSAESAPATGETRTPTASESSDGGLTLAGGSPSVSRVRDDGVDADSAATTAADARESNRSGTVAGGKSGDGSPGDDSRADANEDRSRGDDSSDGADSSDDRANGGDPASNVSTRDDRETETSGFGTLSGRTKTTRVTNDAFGADVETQTEDERYQALGAAIGSGRNVSVKGLLDDDEFLPELPAVEPETTRIEFEDEFEPDAVSEAKAAAEESGFVWVDSGSIETTRVSDR